MAAKIWTVMGAVALVAAVGAASVACSRKAPEGPSAASPTAEAEEHRPAAPPSAEAQQASRAVYGQRCTMCHGLAGHGDGPAAAGLRPRPRDLADPAWQRAAADQDIARVIVGGGPAIGKSLMMPANPDLKDRPEVVAGLVHLVRSFAQP